ncbi:MAG: RDD family protein, partial [Acidobacteria bacterium]
RVRPGSLPADDEGELSLASPALARVAASVDSLLQPPVEQPPAPAPASPPAIEQPLTSPPPAAGLVPEPPPPAGLLARLAAMVIDLGWGAVLGVGVAFALGVADQPQGWQLATLAVAPIFALVILIGWSVWGTSPGKRLLNLYVCTAAGRPGIGLLRAAVRGAGYLLTLLTLGIGFLLAAFGDRRALHDRIAGTYVARLP